MSDKIIKWESRKERKPILSFLLSLLSIGLAQVYNGRPARGMVLFSTVFLSLIFPVIYGINGNFKNITPVYFVSIALALLTIIYSIFAKTAEEISLKRYNSFIFYMLYMLVGNSLLFISIFIHISHFSIKYVGNRSMYPGILEGSIVLLYKDSPYCEYKPADVILYKKGSVKRISRVMASTTGDYIYMTDNRIYINNKKMKKSILTSDLIEERGLPNDEFLYIETNRGKEYPISFNRNSYLRGYSFRHKNDYGEIFILPDNRESRIPETITRKEIYGRVIGIIYSPELKRIFTDL